MHRTAALASALLALGACTGAAPAAGPAPTVIVVSLDGVRHDYPDRGPLPALARMAREGLRAGRLVPVYPSNTFPAHVSLATGAPPDVHGIVDNRFWDRARGAFDYDDDPSWIAAEPLWAAAERQGVPAATFFWVGSGGAWNGIAARHRVAPFDPRVGEAAKVERMLGWLDLPAASRPRLVMSWWHGADAAGHRRGPDHPDVLAALTGQDRQLGALLSGLDARGAWGHTTLLVVSDHGMTTADATIPLRARLREAGVEARVELGSAIAHVFCDGADALERAERALADLPGALVTRREALPAALRLAHPTRTGDLVVRAEPGHSFRAGGLLERIGGGRRGLHGYAPDHPDMAGIFFALGRGVPAGARPAAVRMLDVAATAAALLGIEPPRHSEGTPVPAIAAPAAPPGG